MERGSLHLKCYQIPALQGLVLAGWMGFPSGQKAAELGLHYFVHLLTLASPCRV